MTRPIHSEVRNFHEVQQTFRDIGQQLAELIGVEIGVLAGGGAMGFIPVFTSDDGTEIAPSGLEVAGTNLSSVSTINSLSLPTSTFVGINDIQTLTNKTLTTPTIADFTNAQHDHQDADDGGTLDAAAIASGTMNTARLGSGTANSSTILFGDSTWGPTLSVTEIFADRASQALTAGSTITVTDGEPYTPITSSGAITLTAEPIIAAGRNGQLVVLKNTGAFNIIVSDVNSVGGCLIRLTANTVTIQPGGSMGLIYDSTIGFWIEQWVLNPQTFTPSIATLTSDLAATREVAASGTDTAPNFTLTYVGTPSACSIDVSSGGDPGTSWPISVPAPFTALNGGTTPPTATFNKGTSVAATRVFTATATVAGTAGLTKTLTFTYLNSRYCGPNSQATQLSSAQVSALDDTSAGVGELSNSMLGTFNNIDTGSGEYIWYAHRSALGTVSHFSVEGEAAKFNDLSTMTHTNDSGFSETFRQYRSELTNFGANKDVAALSSEANNRIYMGPSTDTDPISNANILALDDTADGESIVSSTVARTYTAIKIEAGEYLWFCHPDRISDLATIKDAVTGFAIAGSYRSNVTHTNQYGYQETYRCWRSDNVAIFPVANDVVVT